MGTDFLFIKEITQVSPSCFTILWSDETRQYFDLAQLQKNCPCAACCEMRENCKDELKYGDNPGAKKIESVGYYALKIVFLRGCSQGVYTYRYLRELGVEDAMR